MVLLSWVIKPPPDIVYRCASRTLITSLYILM